MKAVLSTVNSRTLLTVAVSCLIILTVFLHYQNTHLKITRYVFSSDRTPREFSGFRIVQISDYHNTRRLENRVVSYTLAEKPDIIAITGDLFDCRKTDVAAGLSLAEKLAEIAPVYMVCGNHEAKINNIADIKKQLTDAGVNIIENRKVNLHRSGQHITLCGMADPQFFSYVKDKETEAEKLSFRHRVLDFMEDTEGFSVLLCHRPEFIHTYRDSGASLVLTGHAHGGQFGIPYTDIGVFVPNQGFFPPYAAGMKQLDDTTVIISRGIGNSVFPFRLFNYPEIVTVELE